MKTKTPIIPTKIDPQMMDPGMTELTGALTANLPWLDKAYSNIETFVEGKGKRPKTYPAVYNGVKKDRGYLKLFPDGHIGNFAFVEVYKQTFDHIPQQSATHIIDFGIVFHFNFEKVYPGDHKNRTLENVKNDVFDILNRYPFANFNVRFDGFVEGANNIYRGYSHDEIEDQFLMRPYGGFKITGKMRFTKKCGGSSSGIITLPSPTTPTNMVMYSLTEAKTGLKDYDGKDIYVSGVEYESPFTSPIIFPNIKRSDLKRIVQSKLTYESIGGGGLLYGEYKDLIITNDNIVQYWNNVNGIQGNPVWFLYYTKL